MTAPSASYMKPRRRLNATTLAEMRRNRSPFVPRPANRRCQYCSIPAGSSVLIESTSLSGSLTTRRRVGFPRELPRRSERFPLLTPQRIVYPQRRDAPRGRPQPPAIRHFGISDDGLCAAPGGLVAAADRTISSSTTRRPADHRNRAFATASARPPGTRSGMPHRREGPRVHLSQMLQTFVNLDGAVCA